MGHRSLAQEGIIDRELKNTNNNNNSGVTEYL